MGLVGSDRSIGANSRLDLFCPLWPGIGYGVIGLLF